MIEIINIIHQPNHTYECKIHHVRMIQSSCIIMFNCTNFQNQIKDIDYTNTDSNDSIQTLEYIDCITFIKYCTNDLLKKNKDANEYANKFTNFFINYIVDKVTDEQILLEIVNTIYNLTNNNKWYINNDFINCLVKLFTKTASKLVKHKIVAYCLSLCSSCRNFNDYHDRHKRHDMYDFFHQFIKIIFSDNIIDERNIQGEMIINLFMRWGCKFVAEYVLLRLEKSGKKDNLNVIQMYCRNNFTNMRIIYDYLINNGLKINQYDIYIIFFNNRNISYDNFIFIIKNFNNERINDNCDQQTHIYELSDLITFKYVPNIKFLKLIITRQSYLKDNVIALYDEGLKISRDDVIEITNEYKISLPSIERFNIKADLDMFNIFYAKKFIPDYNFDLKNLDKTQIHVIRLLINKYCMKKIKTTDKIIEKRINQIKDQEDATCNTSLESIEDYIVANKVKLTENVMKYIICIKRTDVYHLIKKYGGVYSLHLLFHYVPNILFHFLQYINSNLCLNVLLYYSLLLNNLL